MLCVCFCMSKYCIRRRHEHAVRADFGRCGTQCCARREVELFQIAGVFEHPVIEIGRKSALFQHGGKMKADVARMHARLQSAFQCQPHGLGYHDPVGAGCEHAADFAAHAEAEGADRAGVGGMAVVVEIEHARQQHARFHRENVAVAAAADIEKVFHTPLRRGLAVECAAFRRARAAVDHVMIGDHDHLVRRGEAVDAERIELAFRAHHHAVVNHDEVGIRGNHVAGAHRGFAALPGKYFFNGSECGHQDSSVTVRGYGYGAALSRRWTVPRCRRKLERR